jgi:hypothetical protein
MWSLLPGLFQEDGEVVVEASASNGIAGLLPLVFAALLIVGMWRVFSKAGKPGWAAIIPIYNLYVLTQIVGKPAWWLVLFLIPFVNFIAIIILEIELCKSFGVSWLWILTGPILWLVLGFGGATYRGAAAS